LERAVVIGRLTFAAQEDGRILRRYPGQRQGAGLSRHHLLSPSSAQTPIITTHSRLIFPRTLARSPAVNPDPDHAAQAFVRKVASAAGPLPSDMLLSDADALIASGDLAAASAALQVSFHVMLH
jgi:hypothetical protein